MVSRRIAGALLLVVALGIAFCIWEVVSIIDQRMIMFTNKWIALL